MMSAPALPTPQGAMPAGFATFLANIGQLPEGGGEGGGFDQLLAAAPVAVAPSAHAAATIQIDPPNTTVSALTRGRSASRLDAMAAVRKSSGCPSSARLAGPISSVPWTAASSPRPTAISS